MLFTGGLDEDAVYGRADCFDSAGCGDRAGERCLPLARGFIPSSPAEKTYSCRAQSLASRATRYWGVPRSTGKDLTPRLGIAIKSKEGVLLCAGDRLVEMNPKLVYLGVV